MAKQKPTHVYLATDGKVSKIGISKCPETRMKHLSGGGRAFRLVKSWRHADPRSVETACRRHLFHRVVEGCEYFDLTTDEAEQVIEAAIMRVAGRMSKPSQEEIAAQRSVRMKECVESLEAVHAALVFAGMTSDQALVRMMTPNW